MSEYMPLVQSLALVGLTAGIVGAFYRAALARSKAEIDSLARQVEFLRDQPTELLRSKLEQANRRIESNDQIFSDLATILSELCLDRQSGEVVGLLSQDNKMLLREFLFFKAKRSLAENSRSREVNALGAYVAALLDSFENLSGSAISVESYVSRMRSQSDTFFAWLPEILDQGKVREQLGMIGAEDS